MSFNATNITSLNSTRARKIFLSLTAGSVVALVINLVLNEPYFSSEMLLWFVTFFLFAVNFSKIGTDKEREQLAHYSALWMALSIVIGLLMGNSFVEIVFDIQLSNSTVLGNIKLFTALLGNVVFLVSRYAFYYFGTEEKGNE